MKTDLLTLLRHQVGSLFATLVDFSAMIALAGSLGQSPVRATVAGAACGAVANFFLGRRWIFRAAESDRLGQALRYGAVAVISLLLNATGEWVLVEGVHVQYVLARAVVSVAVSLAWNFPLQRRFVFPL